MDELVLDEIVAEIEALSGEVECAGLSGVELDMQAALKVVKHCSENVPDVVRGGLFGAEVGEVVEVTEALGMAGDGEETVAGDMAAACEAGQLLRAAGGDGLLVGWYTTAFMGHITSKATVAMQLAMQRASSRAVMLAYDPVAARMGRLVLKAYRLTPGFVARVSRAADDDAAAVFAEVPVTIRAAPEDADFLASLDSVRDLPSLDPANLASKAFARRAVDSMLDMFDELTALQRRQLMRPRKSRTDEDDADRLSFIDTALLSNQIALDSMQLQEFIERY